jgi:hypothetical protein
LTSQLFESASLEEALAEVRDTVGPGAKIVRAEKVRRGGIAGFFAKESFVLAVEHDGATTTANSIAVPVQRAVPVHPAPPAHAEAWTRPAEADTWNDPYQDRFSAPMDTPAAYSLEALVDFADFADRSDETVESQPHADLETPVSTETPLFGQVLRDVGRATAHGYDESFRSVMPLVSAPAAPVTPPVVRALPTVPYFEEEPAAAEAPVVDEAPSDWDSPVPAYQPTAPQQPWWQTLAAVAETQAAELAAAAPELPPAPAWIDLSTPRPTAPPPSMPAAAPSDDRLGDALFAAGPEPVSPEPAPVADPVVIVRPMPGSPRANTPEQAPASSQSTAGLAAGLATINAALGPALLPGSVIAVVGHPADATKVAARVAVAASADPFAIHIASQDTAALQRSGLPTGRQVATLDEAILRSRRWPSRPTPLVVVIDGRDSQWARTVLDAVEATTVLALPSPAHQDDEVRDWVADLGGVQALLLDDTCASTPEALALHGIPALRSPWSLECTRRVGDL